MTVTFVDPESSPLFDFALQLGLDWDDNFALTHAAQSFKVSAAQSIAVEAACVYYSFLEVRRPLRGTKSLPTSTLRMLRVYTIASRYSVQ